MKRLRRYSGFQGEGLKELLLLVHVFNISPFFINDTIMTGVHLEADLVKRGDLLEGQKEVGSGSLTE